MRHQSSTPDAHCPAPATVSAVFAAIMAMLNSSLAILRREARSWLHCLPSQAASCSRQRLAAVLSCRLPGSPELRLLHVAAGCSLRLAPSPLGGQVCAYHAQSCARFQGRRVSHHVQSFLLGPGCYRSGRICHGDGWVCGRWLGVGGRWVGSRVAGGAAFGAEWWVSGRGRICVAY